MVNYSDKRGYPFNFWLRLVSTLLIAASLSACISLITPSVKREVTELKGGNYKIDPEHTSVIFKVGHLGLSTYVGRFNRMRATLDFDPTDLPSTRLSAVVETASVDVNNQDLEQRLKGSSWFNTEIFPEAIFETRSVSPLSENRFLFTGDLTLLDVTRSVSLEGTFNGGANNFLTGKYTLGFTATGSIKRSEFGMDQYIPLVGDQVDIEIFAEFQKQ